MSRIGVIISFACFIAALTFLSAFTTNPMKQALVLQFGQVLRVIETPGLNFKFPLLQNVTFLDKRLLGLALESQEIIAKDQKRLIVDAYAKYKIVNPVLFFQTVHTEAGGQQRLVTFLQSSLRAVVAEASFASVVRDKRAKLMEKIRKLVDRKANDFGVKVIDVRIRRADLPPQNSQAVFQRMQTERQREASELRAKGAEEARRIRSKAKAEREIILAEAARDAYKIKGKAEAERAKIFTRYVKDPEFYAFYRSLQAYRSVLANKETLLVLSPDSDFFRYFSAPISSQPRK